MCMSVFGVFFSVCQSDEGMFFLKPHSTFHFRLHGIRLLEKDNLDSERGNLPHPLHRLFFLISSKGSFICTFPQTV